MVRLIVAPLPAVAASLGDVSFDPDDRLDAALTCFTIEIDGAIERAVVRHGNRFLAQRLRAIHQGSDLGHAVQQRKLGMSV